MRVTFFFIFLVVPFVAALVFIFQAVWQGIILGTLRLFGLVEDSTGASRRRALYGCPNPDCGHLDDRPWRYCPRCGTPIAEGAKMARARMAT